MKNLFRLVVFYGVLGLVLGVFYREYTKIRGFYESTTLSVLHVHALALGFIFFLVLFILNRLFLLDEVKSYKPWLLFYNIGLLGVLATLGIRGVITVESTDISGLNHIAGLFHTFMGISFIWFFIILKKAMRAPRALPA